MEKIIPATRTESTNSKLALPDNNKSSLNNQKYESENSCNFCSNKFKSLNHNHVTKLHENNRQLKCAYCERCFSKKKTLDAHITSVHQKENPKHTAKLLSMHNSSISN